ncbi:MAG: hypothetical protein JJU13_06950 [Balneolaceae bacterium]|nr:hypothetical protein [Balneolaceae bacterium]
MRSFFSLINALDKNYKTLLFFWNNEKRKSEEEVSLKERLWLWKNGFNTFQKSRYGLTKENIHLYLDTWRYKKNAEAYNGIFNKVIDNKAMIPFLLPKNLTCENYIIFEKGKYAGANFDIDGSVENFLMEQVKQKEYIYKPVYSSLGSGVILLTEENIKRVLGFARLKKKTAIISEKLYNLPYSDQIFSGCTNTIRINVIRDPKTNQLYLLDANQKFGTNKSAPVDNFGKGALLFNIDIENGTLLEGYQKNEEGYTKTISHHPDTNLPITGIQIPGWKDAVNNLLQELNKLVWLRYSGIDAVLTRDGFKIIELNSIPGLEGVQSRIPLFKDPRTRAFLNSVGIQPRKKIENSPE